MKKFVTFLLIFSITILSFTSLVYAENNEVSPLSDFPDKWDTTK